MVGFFLTWYWKFGSVFGNKQNTRYFCSLWANNLFETVIVLAIFWITNHLQTGWKIISSKRTKFDNLRLCSQNFSNTQQNEFAKQQIYQTTPLQWTTFCPVLCPISPLILTEKITSWKILLEKKNPLLLKCAS